MKTSLMKMAVLAAIVLSLTLVQAINAQEVTVEGDVYSVSIDTSSSQVDEGDGTITTVYCIPFNHLANKHQVVLGVGDKVSIEAYDRTFSDGTTKLVAISLTVEGVTVQLR